MTLKDMGHAENERPHESLVLKTSGLPLYFFGLFIAVVGWIVVGGVGAAIISFLQNDTAVFMGIRVEKKEVAFMPLAAAGFGWMIYYFMFYLTANRIVLDGEDMIVDSYLKPTNSSIAEYLIPKKSTIRIKIENIQSIVLETGYSMVISDKDGKHYFSNFKPFSKKGLSRLVNKLREHNVFCQTGN